MASGGSSNSQQQETNSTSIIGIVAIVLIVFGSVVGLSIAGRSTDDVLYLVPLIAAPAILAFQAVRKQDRIKEQVTDVQSKVNGRTDRLMDDKARLEAQLISEGLVPVTHVDLIPEGGKHHG